MFEYWGGDLDEFITKQGNKHLDEEQVIKILIQICLGLREVHAK